MVDGLGQQAAGKAYVMPSTIVRQRATHLSHHVSSRRFGSAAVGAAKGAGDLVTLHPIDAGAAVGKGAAKAGKDVTVGTAKGVGKIGKGVGHALRRIF